MDEEDAVMDGNGEEDEFGTGDMSAHSSGIKPELQ
jgi:hypothetical protein